MATFETVNKEYVYRVYDSDGVYVGVWPDVADDLEFSQRLNTPGTTTTVRLGRSANKTVERRDTLATELPEDLTDESGDPLVAVYTTNNTIGEDTDVNLNYTVDIYVQYGSFTELITEDLEMITTEGDEELIVAEGAPLGTRVFSGIIIDYEATYGDQEYVDVLIASHGLELSNEVIKSGSDTTVTFTTQAPETIIKSILDTNPGSMSYSTASIDATGITISEKFRLNTKLEGIESVYNQTDAGWYWYGNVADRNIYLKEKGIVADHTFHLMKQIKEVKIKRSMEDLRNTVYFVGGDTGGGVMLYKKYTDATSITDWRQGVFRITDRRYTSATNAQRYADKIFDRYAQPIYSTTVQIAAADYNIEDIQLGQMVSFGNFGNFIDDLLLQIVALSYTPYVVTLTLGELLDRQSDVVGELVEDLQNEQYNTIPSAPS